ncbi:hypothetical protein JG687_00009514 [Phytophthora cactorum]|uniref:Uncharacterized protein n=1 Tax=Phytophthora cactorum TaxID=29920 RepID=A0A329RQ16_9STRA|nr:hypothetical protein Pcac1_g18894 [Phytophthora cactorum]KAG2972136.1 hypothetical protein PC118_g15854 [Phytophthora cactorum]KAG3019199.1 hypothetical protein PC119_g10404 [Phytophthora cactorum]KAG4231676.1 hypothetical protein PC116_g20069 [Phytophthora cactorum]KAG6958240.1 hypothetical protein JG687_00009514 [Phytophthora cactorum]
MSGGGSLYLSALFFAADFGQAFLEFRELRANANVLVAVLHGHQSTPRSKDDRCASVDSY